MDKKALEEKFEAIAIQNCWNINKYPAGCDGHGDDEYADDFVNGAWWAFQHQQAKVEEQAQEIANLKSLIQGHELRHQQNLSIKQKLTRRSEELQKRVESALARANQACISNEMFHKQFDDVIRILKGEQALKGEGCQ